MKRAGALLAALLLMAILAGCESMGFQESSGGHEMHPGHPGHEVH
jgi:hypothetical protein